MKVAAIVYGAGQSEIIDRLLIDVAHRLKATGLKLAGSVQWNSGERCGMNLEDLASGRQLNASLPPAQPGCRLDTSALEDAAGLAAISIEPGLDLVIVNRFGKEEAAGRGFRAVIESAVAKDLPVLTSLRSELCPSFDDFTGEDRVYLAPSQDAVERWCEDVLSHRLGKARERSKTQTG